MKRWIILADDGTLGIQCTSGFEPPGAICPCRDEWILDELTYDFQSKIVFHDQAKVQAKKDLALKTKWQIEKDLDYEAFKRIVKSWLPILREALAFASGLVLGLLL